MFVILNYSFFAREQLHAPKLFVSSWLPYCWSTLHFVVVFCGNSLGLRICHSIPTQSNRIAGKFIEAKIEREENSSKVDLGWLKKFLRYILKHFPSITIYIRYFRLYVSRCQFSNHLYYNLLPQSYYITLGSEKGHNRSIEGGYLFYWKRVNTDTTHGESKFVLKKSCIRSFTSCMFDMVYTYLTPSHKHSKICSTSC